MFFRVLFFGLFFFLQKQQPYQPQIQSATTASSLLGFVTWESISIFPNSSISQPRMPHLKDFSTHHWPLGYVISGEGKLKQMNLQQLGEKAKRDSGSFPTQSQERSKAELHLKAAGIDDSRELLPITYFLYLPQL